MRRNGSGSVTNRSRLPDWIGPFFAAAHPAGRTDILPAGYFYVGTRLRDLAPEAPSEGCGEKDAEGNDADHP